MRFALVLIGHGGRPRHPPHPAIRQRRAVRPTQLSRPRPPSALRPTTLPGRRLWPSDGCPLCATAFSTAPHWTFSPSKSWTRSITMTLGSTVVRPLVRPIIISGGPFGLDVRLVHHGVLVGNVFHGHPHARAAGLRFGGSVDGVVAGLGLCCGRVSVARLDERAARKYLRASIRARYRWRNWIGCQLI